MSLEKSKIDKLLRDLQERAKELNCLYRVEELLNQAAADGDLEPLFKAVVATIPEGWQYPECCQAAILYQGRRYETPGYVETEWTQKAEIWIHDNTVGEIIVSYCREVPLSQDGVFLKEEEKLIRTIADRLAHTIFHRQLKDRSQEWEHMQSELARQKGSEWIAIVDMLRKTDRQAFLYISQKMQHHLCWNGVEAAERLFKNGGMSSRALMEEANSPSQRGTLDALIDWSNQVFRIAAEHYSNDHILASIQRWMQEDRSKFLMRAIDHPDSSLSDVVDAITRYQYLAAEGLDLPPSMGKGLAVALVRRFFSDQLEFINIAKDYLGIAAYPELIKRIIFPAKSHGKLGGKSAGLILAWQMVQEKITDKKFLESIRIPKSWYVTSDAVINFLYYNNMEDIIEHKYKERDEIILEYPNIVQLFKVSPFPPEIVKGLAAALDDLGETPIIVRSSSLLEDRIGAAFSGKYKSLFLANQGSKQERLEALIDAIAEIYASTFGPDPIEYRRERGLLDFSEEMGVMIQEVVGSRVGRYFFPTFAGVAFSNNEFRWSDRIKREDGLIRLVPGLGTRAVDRVADDYPVLMAPGKPDLRVNVSPDEILRYSPKLMDVIDLEANRFVTKEVREVLREFGDEIPAVHQMVSICDGHLITEPTSRFNINMKQDQLVATFEGLATRTPFLKQMRALLKALEAGMGAPVDIEFAHDGKCLYLLQCRPQSYSRDNKPTPIPKDLPLDAVVFTAKRYVSNGYVPDATHIVYVDPEGYNRMGSLEALKTVGRAVGKLNEILPKRQFVLMGPGRWGSRGDVKLGVSVTYSDINNTSMLIEIAKKKGNYTPDPLLPRPGGGVNPLPAPLPRRRRRDLQRTLLPGRREPATRTPARIRPSVRYRARHRRAQERPGPRASRAAQRRPGRGRGHAGRSPRGGDRGGRGNRGSPPDSGGLLEVAAAHGRAHRRAAGRQTVRGQGILHLWKHEKRHGRAGQRHRPATSRRCNAGTGAAPAALAGGVEPHPVGDELLEDGVPDRGALGRAPGHRRRHRKEDKLGREDWGHHRRGAAAAPQEVGMSSRVAWFGRRGSKRTRASSGPSWAADSAWVRPRVSHQWPVSRADSWT